MSAQLWQKSQINRTLQNEMAVSRIAATLSQEQFDSRRSLGRRNCDEFSFVDAAGRLQIAGCMKALATVRQGCEHCFAATAGAGGEQPTASA